MLPMILSRPEFHAVAPELLKAIRRGQLAEVYAELYAELELKRDEYETIGTTLDSTRRMKSNDSKADLIDRWAVYVSGRLGLNGRTSDDPRRKALVDDLFELADRYRKQLGWDPRREALIGYVITAAEFTSASGAPLVPEELAEPAHAAANADRQPVSITDVRDRIRALTKYRLITDWICEEEVERLRPLVRGGLLRHLHSRKAAKWAADIMRSLELVEWLCGRPKTLAEPALLRRRLQELQTKAIIPNGLRYRSQFRRGASVSDGCGRACEAWNNGNP